METKKKYIGLMDPNHYAFLRSLENLIAYIDPKIKIKSQDYDVVTERVKCNPMMYSALEKHILMLL
jgi:hypothetical protein